MGNPNHILLLEKYKDILNGPFLEVGSKDYGSTEDFRPLFSGKGPYVGVDLESGPGVDMILDMTSAFDEIDSRLKGQRFGSIFCMAVLEHCESPFEMAKNPTRLLQDDGVICISVPFSWEVHAYPNDYWRFTLDGVKKLFSQIEFKPEDCFTFTPKVFNLGEITKDIGKISFSFGRHMKQGHPIRGISAKFIDILSKIGCLRWLARNSYVLAPTNLLLVGRKK